MATSRRKVLSLLVAAAAGGLGLSRLWRPGPGASDPTPAAPPPPASTGATFDPARVGGQWVRCDYFAYVGPGPEPGTHVVRCRFDDSGEHVRRWLGGAAT